MSDVLAKFEDEVRCGHGASLVAQQPADPGIHEGVGGPAREARSAFRIVVGQAHGLPKQGLRP
ncbi:hypothetical protein GCM10027030_03380 [Luteococcus sediminum]